MAAPIRATIVGAGIAGLSTAVALKRIGYAVTVIEKESTLKTFPAGLLLQPSAVKVLDVISPTFKSKVDSMSKAVGDISIISYNRNKTIGVFEEQLFKDLAGESYITVPRQSFYNELINEVGPENIRLGLRYKEFFEDRATAEVRTVCADKVEIVSDILIGAEGKRSVMSEQLLYPPTTNYRGVTTWTGIAEGVPESDIAPYIGISFGNSCSSGIFPMKGDKVYWWASYGSPYGPDWDPEGNHNELLPALFKDYQHGPLHSLFSKTKDISYHDVYDKPAWRAHAGRGKVTMVGDAVHLTTPILGGGADAAIEDAACLSKSLQQSRNDLGPNLVHGLRQYEIKRFAKTRNTMKATRLLNNFMISRRSAGNYMAWAYAADLFFPFAKYRYLHNHLESTL